MKWFKLPEGTESISIGQRIYQAIFHENENVVGVEDHHEETVRTLIPTATATAEPEWAKEKSPEVPTEEEATSGAATVVQTDTVSSIGSTATLGGSTGTTSAPNLQPSNSTPGGTTKTGTDEGSGKQTDTFTTKTVGDT